MQTRTNLGMSLGQALSSAFGGNDAYKQKGALDGMRANELSSQIDLQTAQRKKAEAEAAAKQQEASYGTDDSIVKSLVSGMQNGVNGDNVANDFNSYLSGNYHPREQQGAALPPGSYMPPPDYVSKFPQLQEKYANIKQMLALGDKNLEHLSGSIRGDQRNNVTRNITPENAAAQSLTVAAIDGKDPSQITDASLTQQIANGGDYGNLAKALLASKGKGAFDSFNGGVTNVLDGTQSINDIGDSLILENKGRANQANAGATENVAQAGLANVRTNNIKEGKGDGSNAQQKDFAQIRDDIRGDYNASYPISSATGRRDKTAPDFNTFTKSWLKEYNIDENDFFRAGNNKTGSLVSSPVKKSSPAYQEYLDAYSKAAGHPDVQKKITERARKTGVVK
jgi:hypothetical protein